MDPVYNFKDINIFIVEDDPDIVELYKNYLSDTQCNLIFFDLDKKSDILKIISENNINVVIMDIMLPNNYDGHSLIKKIKNKFYDMIIIAVTSLTKKEDILKSIKQGADFHINKPVTKNILLSGIKLYLDR